MRQAAADLEWPNTYHTFITTMQTAYHGGKHSECMYVRHGDKLNQLKIHSTTPLPWCTFDLIRGPGEFGGNLQSPPES